MKLFQALFVLSGAAPSFSLLYVTNGDETVTATVDGPVPPVAPATTSVPAGNLGFCFAFQQS